MNDDRRIRSPHSVTLIIMVGLAWVAFAWAPIAAHQAYNSNAYDLGFFDQIIWNTAQGRWFQTSFVPYTFLGQHMEPVLALFAGVYRVWPRVELLLVAQATLVAWAAVPLFLATRRVLASTTAGLLIGAAYLVAPHLHGAVLFDFHPELMGAASLFSAFTLLAARRPGWALAALAPLIALKEDAALAAGGFAFIVWLVGYRRQALVLASGSVLYLIIIAGIVMPALRGGPGDLQERYGYLGDDTQSVLLGALARPDVLLRHLTAPPQREAIIYVLGSQGYLPLASPAVVTAVPLLGANLLSTHPAQHDLTLHYPALAYPLLLVSAVLGIRTLSRSVRLELVRRRLRLSASSAPVALATVLLLAELAGWLLGSPLGPRRFAPERYRRTPHHEAVASVLRAVPAGAPVSAQSGLVPHLSQRRSVWEFPRLEDAAYVVIDQRAWRSSQSEDAGYTNVLRSLPSRGYCLMREADGVMLFAREDRCASR